MTRFEEFENIVAKLRAAGLIYWKRQEIRIT